jgi:transposase
MSRRKKDPLRPLTDDERDALGQLSRSQAAPAGEVARAKLLLLVAASSGYSDAARAVGRKSGDAVSALVGRFSREGLAALVPRHGGGRRRVYDEHARARTLAEAQRTPTPEQDGTATWSLSALKRVLRGAPDGLPSVSTYTVWDVLHAAGYAYQQSRTWCPTGTAQRERKAGVATVTDPDAGPKKSWSRRPTRWASSRGWRCGAATRPGRSRPPRTPARPGPQKDRQPGSRMSTSGTARPRC